MALDELSIFPTATLCFVILGLSKKTGRSNSGFMNHVAHHNEKEEVRSWPAISRAAETWIGGLSSVLGAFVATAIAAGHSWEVWVPLIFSTVLFLVALLFGVRAGLLGTFLAGLVFAVFLFSPIGKMNGTDHAARTNLGWMMLTGIAFSFLFAPSGSRFRHR